MKLVGVVIFLSLSISTYATNYVVIGAFAKKSNAVKLAKKTEASFDLNAVKQLYYVFVLKTDDHEAAFAEARRLQSDSEYKDAWVFAGTLGEGGSGEDIMVPVKVEESITFTQEPIVADTTSKQTVIKEPVEPVVETALDPTVSTKEFYFSVTREDGAKADGAEITAIDPKTQRRESVFKGNENVTMRSFNQSGDVRFECDLAGYRKIVQSVNFKTPSVEDGVSIEGNRIIVPFQLVRLKKGDHSILYNVFFFKDAAIMRPESKVDLDGLLAMMKENPGYKIMIHGHTNGNAAGRILEAGESGDFFTLSGAKEGRGSAKKLSLKRAEVIKEYLAKQGIDPEKMATKAWGGKKPIYDKHATLASANVRVEVEVLEE